MEQKDYIFPVEGCHTKTGTTQFKACKLENRKKSDHAASKNNGIEFSREYQTDFICIGSDREGLFCRIDVLINIYEDDGAPKAYVPLELGESLRTAYTVNYEVRRMTECYKSLALGGNILPVVFIRYNAETWNIDTKIRKTTQEVLEVALLALINYVKLEEIQGLCVTIVL
jgi:hypothetical protein